MRVRTLLLLLILIAIGGFAILNWSAFVAPTPLNLGLAEIQAPLGLVMLGLLTFVIAFFLVYLVYLQSSMLLEVRRNGRELQANRTLADKAEASRFTELREFLDLELKGLANLVADSKSELLARIETLDQGLRLTIEQSGNSLSAQVGQVEDRLDVGARAMTTLPPV